VAGYLSETGTVSIAGALARMTSPTNFEGEITIAAGTTNITVAAIDLSGNLTNITVTRTFTNNGSNTRLTYDLAGNQLPNSGAGLAFSWDGANRCTAITEYSNATLTADRRFIWIGTCG
jgi:YD repeat-containing protein